MTSEKSLLIIATMMSVMTILLLHLLKLQTSLNNSSTSATLTSKQIQDYKQALYGIVDDITERLADCDQNMVSRVTKFIKNYYAYMQI